MNGIARKGILPFIYSIFIETDRLDIFSTEISAVYGKIAHHSCAYRKRDIMIILRTCHDDAFLTVRSYQPDRLICHRDRFIVDSGSNDQNSTILHLIDSILYGSEITGAILSDIIYFIFLCIHPHVADTADHKKHCTYVSHFSLSHIYLYPMLL